MSPSTFFPSASSALTKRRLLAHVFGMANDRPMEPAIRCKRRRGAFSAMLLVLVVAGLVGCSEIEPDEPSVPAAVDTEVAALLHRLEADAEAEPANAERRGELGMAQEVHGFSAAALASYQQAEVLAPDDPRWPHYQALLIAHRGDLDQALERLDRSLALDPDHAPAWLWQGTWLLDLARVDEAVAAFAKAEALGAGLPAQAGRAQALLRRGDAAAARDLLQPLADAHGHPYLLKLLGQAQQRLGHVQAARATLADIQHAAPLTWPDARSAAKRRFEASVSAQLAKVREHLATGDLQTALTAAHALRSDNPKHQGLLNTLAEIYRRLERHDDALRVLQAAAAEHPRHYPFHLQLAEHYIGTGEAELALTHLDSALALNATVPWAHAQRGLLFLEQNRLDAALDAFAEALRQDPKQAQVHYYVAMTAAAQQRWPDAINAFAEAARLQPSFALAHIGLARSLTEAGRFEESRAALASAREIGTHADETSAALAFLRRREAAAG